MGDYVKAYVCFDLNPKATLLGYLRFVSILTVSTGTAWKSKDRPNWQNGWRMHMIILCGHTYENLRCLSFGAELFQEWRLMIRPTSRGASLSIRFVTVGLERLMMACRCVLNSISTSLTGRGDGLLR